MSDVSDFGLVRQMYEKFGFVKPCAEGEDPVPHLIGRELMDKRLVHLREELNELIEGHLENDLPKMADALVDLSVITLGTAAMMDLPWPALFLDVHRANSAKEVGVVPKRGYRTDLVKPKGWRPPNAGRILREYGWNEGSPPE